MRPRIKPRDGPHTDSDMEVARAIVALVDRCGFVSLRDLDNAFPHATFRAFRLAVQMIEGGR
jgi:hypothetical protein